MTKTKSILSVFTLGALGLLLAGCYSTKMGDPIDADKVSQIQKGVTTRTQVEAMFGAPMSSSMMGDGRRMLVYNYSEFNGHMTGPWSGAGQNRSQMLQIMLDQNNVVQDYELSDGTTQFR